MELKHQAIAGTLESSDIQVIVEPHDQREINLTSSVIDQFGDQIYQTIEKTLDNLEIQGVKLTADDHGALDCTIRSRVQTAVFRALDQDKDLPWGTKI
ncbi:citrate lyase ACP [Aerococcus urinaehominis]|uniref:Citrate lyase acyl carrier protein n=1 Tax=Aerococcus urinaehominis TaxID=128944 RepID=A0A0X8FLX6_9LACT|nr:citrate lyase acyl carrier protein [Aerococcus urinaehominis]AMB99733.1 citrate lyase ACP [Aerococcus urinaehominis]SDM11054.1 citrate lyase subunit gamma (acyl carrier protein) [Aerococcus urinaehominis]